MAITDSEIDQGTVIYGIKSDKYPTTPCYGVIITARCDIAQKKVPKYYYLVAVDASTWFCTAHGYQQVYSASIKQKRSTICSKALELELDGDVLLSVSTDLLEQIMNSKKIELCNNRKSEKKINELLHLINEYSQLTQENADDRQRKQAVKRNSSTAKKYLSDVDTGKYHQYYYLPQAAYLTNGVKSRGLIVDMLEIGTLSLSDAQKISSPLPPDICYSALPEIPEKDELNTTNLASGVIFSRISEYVRLKSSFWLEDDSDFVCIEGTTASPWCEHLMQRFSNVFIRIGLDNPTEQDFSDVIAGCYTEEDK